MQTSILFLIDSLQVLGGAEKNLMQVVSLLDRSKYSPIVYCLKNGKADEELKSKKIYVHELKIKRIYGLDAFIKGIKFIRFIRKNKIKIFVTYFESSNIWGSIIARIAGVPVVISSRRDLGFNLKTRHILAYKITNHLFDKIIAVCEAVKWNIVKTEKVSPNKIITIYNGVSLYKNNTIDKSGINRALGLEPNKLTVTILANLDPVKGHKDFLVAASEVLKSYKSVQFLLVGEGKKEYEQYLHQLVDKLGIKNNVIFAGFRPDIQDVLSISDICVSSSSSEGLSNSILEFMSAGKPVVATDAGGNRELVVDEKTGILVPPSNPRTLASSIERLLENRQLAESMGQAGRKRIEELFSSKKMMQEIEDLYDTLLSKKENWERLKIKINLGTIKKFLIRTVKIFLANFIFYSGLIHLFKKNTLTILVYHRVNNDYFCPDGMNLSVESFESQIRHLKKNYNLVSLEETIDFIREKSQIPRNSIVITFDDGYKDNYTNVFPLLKKYGIPATIFLSVGAIEEKKSMWLDVITNAFKFTRQKFIDLHKFNLKKYDLTVTDKKLQAINGTVSFAKSLDEEERKEFIDYLLNELKVDPVSTTLDNLMLSWEEIKEMKNSGITFGSHGMGHSILTKIPKEKLIGEIVASKQIIKEKAGIATKFFAYPNGQTGDFNEETAQLLKKNGYEAGFTLVKGYNNSTSDLFTLKRLCISQDTSSNSFTPFSALLFDMEILGCFRFLTKARWEKG